MKLSNNLTNNVIIAYHKEDLDGVCSKDLLVHFLEEENVNKILRLPLDYSSSIFEKIVEFATDIQSNKYILYIVDLSIDFTSLKKLDKIFKKVVVFDHHITTFESIIEAERKEERDVFIDGNVQDIDYNFYANTKNNFIGQSAIMHIWDYFMGNESEVSLVVKLISDYDTWNFTSKEHFLECIKMQFALQDNYGKRRHFITSPHDDIVRNIMKKYDSVVSFIQNNDQHIVDTLSEEISFEGMKGLIIPTSSSISKLSEWCIIPNKKRSSECGLYVPTNKKNNISLKDAYDFICSYYYKNHKFIYSLRSKDGQALEIAKKYGGGGHENAAGFVSKDYIFP